MPSDGARDDHGDDGDDHKMIWKIRKRKRKPMENKAKVLLRILVLMIKTP